MKRLYIYLLISFFVGGVFLAPFFVRAEDVCYVDEKADDDGDGSSDKPYKKISKAIDKDCGEIRLSKGTFKEDITLKKSMTLRGNNRDNSIIEGKVTMNDKSEFSKITVLGGGVEIAEGADAEIGNARIKDSNIGINTVGKGKLIVNDTTVSGNRKGMYIQYGKSVKITNCKVYNNKEEGLDVRANVTGSINGNEIYSNGESGIEIILGKSEMNIFNNDIKKNGASGIAAQFYSDTEKLGDVNIKNNIVTSNSNFGLDCKAPSGGSGRPKGYWSDSMDLTSNKIINNKDKDIAGSCKFDEDKIADATQTKEQREAERLALEEKQSKKVITATEEIELAELTAQKEEEERIAQKDKEEKALIDSIYQEVENLYIKDEIIKNKIENKNKFLKFFIGEDYKNLRDLHNNLTIYDEKIDSIEEKKGNIADESISNGVGEKISTLQRKREDILKFIDSKGDDFSLWGWLFEDIYYKDKKVLGIFQINNV